MEDTNRLIAEFMGVVFHDDENNYYNADGLYIGNTLQYHASWDWLMPVVEEIEGKTSERYHKISVDINELDCVVYGLVPSDREVIASSIDAASKREATYQAVVEFIKQHNKKA